MNIKNLLASSSYIIYNIEIAKKTSIKASILLGYLYSLYNYFDSANQLIERDGKHYFYCTRDTIFDKTAITEDCQRKIINELVELGIIETIKIGIPAKNYYYLNDEAVMALLDNDTKEAPKKKPQTVLGLNIPKKSNNFADIPKMYSKTRAMTKDKEIQGLLDKYLDSRKLKKLTLQQWDIILEDLFKYVPVSNQANVIRKAIAGGYMMLVYENMKTSNNINNIEVRFDDNNTEEVREERTQRMLEDIKAKDV